VQTKLQAIDVAVEEDEVGGSGNSKLQKTILCTWLTEMFLNQLNILQQPAINYGMDRVRWL
jgi:hypothetical protein